MSKKRTIISILKHAQEILQLLEASGIDIDRLIAISNAQGPQAKLIKAVLEGDILADESGIYSRKGYEGDLRLPAGALSAPSPSKGKKTRSKKVVKSS